MEAIDHYKQTVTLLEELVEFHPAYLEALTQDDRDVLSRYYFAGRDVDVDDLGEYRSKLVNDEAGIESRAQDALARFKAVANLR